MCIRDSSNIQHASMADIHGLPLAMPDDVKGRNVVKSYRRYYKKYKMPFARYTKREIPEFMVEELHAGYAS